MPHQKIIDAPHEAVVLWFPASFSYYSVRSISNHSAAQYLEDERPIERGHTFRQFPSLTQTPLPPEDPDSNPSRSSVDRGLRVKFLLQCLVSRP